MNRGFGMLVIAGCVLAILAVGVLDWWTGTEIRVFPLYFLPIAVGVQVGVRSVRYALAGLATVTWKVAHDLAGGQPDPLIDAANVIAQFSAFMLMAFLVGRQWTQRKREEARSREDYLTGLYNSRAFFDVLVREVERARRYRHPLTLAYLDLDDFKRINDTLGHPAGDEVLRAVARILRSFLRSSDVVARLGGDEFAILLVETRRSAAEKVLRKLHDRISAELAASAAGTTVSVGAAIVETRVPPPDEFIRRADALMYEVKRSGKNGCLVRAIS